MSSQLVGSLTHGSKLTNGEFYRQFVKVFFARFYGMIIMCWHCNLFHFWPKLALDPVSDVFIGPAGLSNNELIAEPCCKKLTISADCAKKLHWPRITKM